MVIAQKLKLCWSDSSPMAKRLVQGEIEENRLYLVQLLAPDRGLQCPIVPEPQFQTQHSVHPG